MRNAAAGKPAPLMLTRRGMLAGLFGVAAPTIISVRDLMALPRHPLYVPEPGELN
jgi:hypothetical protein